MPNSRPNSPSAADSTAMVTSVGASGKNVTNAIGTGTFSRNIDASDSGINTPVAACSKGIAKV